jgi:hypothetical protein
MDFHQYWPTFNGPSPILAKVFWTFANIGESMVIHWRKFSGFSPIGESTQGLLAKDQWTFANGESPICEIPIGELPATHLIHFSFWKRLIKTFWW